ncbi:MAG: T9SS C-terminal target domain-containing protein [Cryomorphaceae bacterium]|nr:MAG: T9SS C-terminal target domain-containing protein [Cryomorphaceae bacterium]
MWLGVEVWGDPTAAQFPFSNQGYLHMTNNSVIEHAYIGAMAASRQGSTENNLFQFNETGGVIRAYNSRFRNNQRDVLVQNYLWLNSQGSVDPNRCYFENCDFLTDGLLNNPAIMPDYHVQLHRVQDVTFRNCSWRNTSQFADFEIDQRGTGLYALQATFRVTGQNEPYEAAHDALPISDNVHQCFYQLYNGVLVVGAENDYFTASRMEFQHNQRGMIVFGVSRENITFNNFHIPVLNSNYPEGGYGAYLANTYLFTVEENNFFADEVSVNTGLIVDNSNKDASFSHLEVDNEVYRNTFNKLNVGVSVVNNNRGPIRNMGLQARCNQFSEAGRADIFLTPETEWRDDQGSGLQVEWLTNNVFSYPNYPASFPYRDVRVHETYGANSGSGLMFQYWCLQDDPTTQPVFDVTDPQPEGQAHMEVTHNILYNGVLLDFENHCPSNFTTQGDGKYPLATLMEKQATADSNLESALALYQVTIDGGETEDIIDLLQNIHNEESAYLRDLLLARYPLSREALMAAIDAAESFDPWHLTQVLVANSRLPGDVYTFLKDNAILSPFFMQFIDDAQQNSGASLARLLHAEISQRCNEKSQTERAIHRHFLYHPDSIDHAAWNAYLESRPEPHYKLHRIGAYLRSGNTGMAQTLLDSLDVHPDRKGWVQFMINTATADSITEAHLATGWDFFYNAPLTLGDAWGWLYAQGATDSLPPQPVILDPKSMSSVSSKIEEKPERYLQAWPNPTKDRVVLTYPKEAEGLGMVQIFNLDGQLIREFAASDAGFQEIYVTGWPAGIYIAKLIVNNKNFDTVKISVVK